MENGEKHDNQWLHWALPSTAVLISEQAESVWEMWNQVHNENTLDVHQKTLENVSISVQTQEYSFTMFNSTHVSHHGGTL